MSIITHYTEKIVPSSHSDVTNLTLQSGSTWEMSYTDENSTTYTNLLSDKGQNININLTYHYDTSRIPSNASNIVANGCQLKNYTSSVSSYTSSESYIMLLFNNSEVSRANNVISNNIETRNLLESSGPISISSLSEIGDVKATINYLKTKNPSNNHYVRIYGSSITFEYDIYTYEIDVASNNPSFGSVTGGGEYEAKTVYTITAKPNPGYVFTGWSDGSTDATRAIVAEADVEYIAYFAQAGSSRLFVNKDGVWKPVEKDKVKVNGNWTDINSIWTKSDGNWTKLT